MPEGLLVQGDNLAALRMLSDSCIDLIYLDPPFHSEQVYKTSASHKSSAGEEVFDDRWRWDDRCDETLEKLSDAKLKNFLGALETVIGRTGRLAYLLFLAPRLIEMNRVLKDSGSIYLHCDQTASAYLKISLDVIFGQDNFLNTIVWCYGLGGSSTRRYPRKHDDLLWYAKNNGKHYFHPPMEPAKSLKMKGMDKKIPDYWDIPSINNMAKERTGYPTQKPLTLLKRVVESSCPKNGKVFDPFCGSGTTLVAASSLERDWIGIDNSPRAIETTIRRLESTGFDRNISLQKWAGV